MPIKCVCVWFFLFSHFGAFSEPAIRRKCEMKSTHEMRCAHQTSSIFVSSHALMCLCGMKAAVTAAAASSPRRHFAGEYALSPNYSVASCVGVMLHRTRVDANDCALTRYRLFEPCLLEPCLVQRKHEQCTLNWLRSYCLSSTNSCYSFRAINAMRTKWRRRRKRITTTKVMSQCVKGQNTDWNYFVAPNMNLCLSVCVNLSSNSPKTWVQTHDFASRLHNFFFWFFLRRSTVESSFMCACR